MAHLSIKCASAMVMCKLGEIRVGYFFEHNGQLMQRTHIKRNRKIEVHVIRSAATLELHQNLQVYPVCSVEIEYKLETKHEETT